MSSFFILGLFALSGGNRVVSPRPNSDKTTSHILYMTSLQLFDLSFVPGEIRVWAPMTTPILPDNTVVFMLAKACTPADTLHGAVVMDSVLFQPFPGDPESSAYEDHLPDGQVPWVIATGKTISQTRTLADGCSRAFELSLTEYVRDEQRQSGIHCIFDGMTPRWARAPTPYVNSSVQVVGPLASIHSNGMLSVNIEHLTLSVNISTGVATSSDTGSEDPPASTGPVPIATPTKKRKFAAALPSPAPSPVRHTPQPLSLPTPGPSSPSKLGSPAPVGPIGPVDPNSLLALFQAMQNGGQMPLSLSSSAQHLSSTEPDYAGFSPSVSIEPDAVAPSPAENVKARVTRKTAPKGKGKAKE
ncbi:hypothetical protein NEOLEDRAFT_1177742 [Neolentinus lepideus HHB14362 ss-1]|uniref:Uncharacterized protein n=1 Tax=Neolentinus lepideus HHB14362 ss-1 TaxID=1314782 RepID=A0A165T971_9AGAM|nr:hypothetical protein NEOLEDRAFT_1177742 [Neolentinus lepideus HHB14362 ss-1]